MTSGEKTVLRFYLNELAKKGWYTIGVNDGEEVQKPARFMADSALCSWAITVVESVDESWVRLRNAALGQVGILYIVLGNDPNGTEVVCDMSDLPNFNEVAALADAKFHPA